MGMIASIVEVELEVGNKVTEVWPVSFNASMEIEGFILGGIGVKALSLLEDGNLGDIATSLSGVRLKVALKIVDRLNTSEFRLVGAGRRRLRLRVLRVVIKLYRSSYWGLVFDILADGADRTRLVVEGRSCSETAFEKPLQDPSYRDRGFRHGDIFR